MHAGPNVRSPCSMTPCMTPCMPVAQETDAQHKNLHHPSARGLDKHDAHTSGSPSALRPVAVGQPARSAALQQHDADTDGFLDVSLDDTPKHANGTGRGYDDGAGGGAGGSVGPLAKENARLKGRLEAVEDVSSSLSPIYTCTDS